MTNTNNNVLEKNISEMTITDLYKTVLEQKTLYSGAIKPPRAKDLKYLSLELLNTKDELIFTKRELTNSTNVITGLSKDLSKNRNDLQQSRLEVQQSRLETQHTRLELLNLKNDSKHVIENLNNRLDELIRVNEKNMTNLYQNVVNGLDEHFSGGKEEIFNAAKRQKLELQQDQAQAQQKQEEHLSESEVIEEEEEEEVVGDDDSVLSSPSSINSKKSQRVPMYRLIRGTDSISLIWEEYIRGVNGGPAVKELEEKYQYRWRDDKERSRLGHRKKIYTMIEKAIANGWDEKKATEYLDNYLINGFGEKRSFAWLFENIPEGFK